MKGESDRGEREWSGEGREWSGVMEGGGVREKMVWCDVGLLFVEGGWSSMVGVASWALSSMNGWLSFVMGGCHLWVGDGCSWWGWLFMVGG